MIQKILLLFAIALSASAVLAQDTKDRALITVSGQAEVRVPPDEVVFTLEVESIDKDVLAAKKKTDESVKAVFAIAKDNHVKADDVQTSYISVEPRYNTDDLEYEARRGVKRVFLGYKVSKTIAIRLKDIPRFDSLLSDVLKAGVTKVSNVEFRDSQIRKHKDQARAMAIKAAQEKATLLAREIGQTIGPAYSITEDSGTRFADNNNNNMMQNTTSVISGDLSASESDSALAPGLISVTARVTVSFRLQ
ncbi:MAG: SIMPL domain-containing protein [bacterium]